MSGYPFYDSFNTKIKDKDLTPKQKEDFQKKIVKIDLNGREIIYAIIRVHDMLNTTDSSMFKIPYSGCINSDNVVQFDFELFPFKLKQILYKYLKTHLKKMKEDKKKIKG